MRRQGAIRPTAKFKQPTATDKPKSQEEEERKETKTDEILDALDEELRVVNEMEKVGKEDLMRLEAEDILKSRVFADQDEGMYGQSGDGSKSEAKSEDGKAEAKSDGKGDGEADADAEEKEEAKA